MCGKPPQKARKRRCKQLGCPPENGMRKTVVIRPLFGLNVVESRIGACGRRFGCLAAAAKSASPAKLAPAAWAAKTPFRCPPVSLAKKL